MKDQPNQPKNFADGKGYKTPLFARPLLSMLPSAHLKDQPPSFNILAGPYNSGEYKAALKTIGEYSRAGKALAFVYTRTLIYIAEDTSRELLAVEAPVFPSSPVQAPVIPGPSQAFRLAPFVVPHLPAHHAFIDLLGSDASLLILKPRVMHETYNDRSEEVGNLFQVLRGKGAALAQLLALTPYEPGKFRKSADCDHHDPLEKARRTVLRLAQVASRDDWRTYQNALPGIADRLRDVEIVSCQNPARLIETRDRSGVHFHLDRLADPDPSHLESLAALRASTVSVLSDQPEKLPFQSEVHPLPDSGFYLTIGCAADRLRKRTAETRLPKPIKIQGEGARETLPPRGFPVRSEVAGIRHRLNLSQADFARLLGVPVGTLRNWESGGTLHPASLTLLRIAATRPEVLRNL